MLENDNDILVDNNEENQAEIENSDTVKLVKSKIKLNHFILLFAKSCQYFFKAITSKYIQFSSRATRLEFWGYAFIFSLSYAWIYYLALYTNMNMLSYAYIAALFIPTISLIVRRLHDINKNVILFLGSGALILFSAIFIKIYVAIPFIAWAVLMIKELSKPSVNEANIYGEFVDDETFEKYETTNSFKIIKLFRLTYLVVCFLTVTTTVSQLEIWTQKAQEKDIVETLLTNVITEGKKQHLSNNQILQAQSAMRETLKTLSGKTVSDEDIQNFINQSIEYGKQQDL